jgi:hypothetical protein
MSDLNNTNILVGSVKKALDMRLILGDTISTDTIVLFNTLKKALEYSQTQYNAGNLEYSTKIRTIEGLMKSLRYKCPSICNYHTQFVSAFDFKASNATITIDTVNYKISQLQIQI